MSNITKKVDFKPCLSKILNVREVHVLGNFNELYRVLLVYPMLYLAILGYTRNNWAIKGYTLLYRATHGYTIQACNGLYSAIQGYPEAILANTRLYTATMGRTGFCLYLALPRYSGLY